MSDLSSKLIEYVITPGLFGRKKKKPMKEKDSRQISWTLKKLIIRKGSRF